MHTANDDEIARKALDDAFVEYAQDQSVEYLLFLLSMLIHGYHRWYLSGRNINLTRGFMGRPRAYYVATKAN